MIRLFHALLDSPTSITQAHDTDVQVLIDTVAWINGVAMNCLCSLQDGRVWWRALEVVTTVLDCTCSMRREKSTSQALWNTINSINEQLCSLDFLKCLVVTCQELCDITNCGSNEICGLLQLCSRFVEKAVDQLCTSLYVIVSQ